MFLSLFLHTVVCIHKKIEVQKIFEKNKHLNIILLFFFSSTLYCSKFFLLFSLSKYYKKQAYMTIKKKLLTLKYTFKSIIEKKNISNATVELHS